MRWIGTVTGAALVVAAVAVGAVLLDGAGDDAVRPAGVVAADGGPSESTTGRDDRSQGQGPPPWVTEREQGPPPWAAKGADKTTKPGKDWASTWRAMPPKERERTMSRLAREHADGMRDFGRCMAEKGDRCERPLPPGLARKAELGGEHR